MRIGTNKTSSSWEWDRWNGSVAYDNVNKMIATYGVAYKSALMMAAFGNRGSISAYMSSTISLTPGSVTVLHCENGYFALSTSSSGWSITDDNDILSLVKDCVIISEKDTSGISYTTQYKICTADID